MNKDRWSVCFVYIATVIGAGFATGQEISTYFVSCGWKGFLGIFLAAVLIGFCCYAVLMRVHKSKILNFEEYLYAIMPKGLAMLVDKIVSLFLLCGFCVMVAAFGTTLEEHYGLYKPLCCLVLCMICFFVFLRPIRLLVKLNTLLAPFIILGLFLACLCVIFMRETAPVSLWIPSTHTMAKDRVGFLWLALLYVSYNILLASVILAAMRVYIHEEKDAVRVSLVSGLIMFLLLGLIYAVIQIYEGKIWLGQIPMLTIVARLGSGYKSVYALVLLFAIFTTAMGNGYGFLDHYSGQMPRERLKMALLTCLTAMGLSFVSFADLVKYLYGAFGVCGLYLLICILVDGVGLAFFKKISKTAKKIDKTENNEV